MGINPIQNVIPTQNTQNFMQDYLQGLKYGQELQAMQKQNELLKKQELFKQDYATLSQNPSGQGMLNLMVKYPEFAAQLKPVQEAFGTAEKQGELSQLMQLDNALYNNNVDLANTIVDNTIKAFENSGRPTAQLQTIKQLIEKDPTQAAGATSQALAMLLGDKYKTYEEGRTTFLQRGSDVKKAEGQATKAVAEGKTAQVDMEVKIATKQSEIDRLRALSEKATSDAEKASIEAQIAVATKDMKILKQKYETQIEGEKLTQEKTKTTYLEPELEQKIKNLKLEGDIKAQEVKLKILDVKLAKEENPLKIKKLKAEIGKVENEVNEKVNTKVAELNSGRMTIDNMLNTIDKLTNNPALDKITGPIAQHQPVFTMSNKEADANALLETLRSQAFLSQVTTMKGMGALSDAEGKKLEAGLANLSRAQSPQQLRATLKEVTSILQKSRKNLELKLGVDGNTGITNKQPNRPNYKPTAQDIDALLKKYGK